MQDKDKSTETMKGVLLSYKEGYQNGKKDYSLTILIDDPFNAKINIEIDTDEWNEYINYFINIDRKWKGILESHPEKPNSGDCYLNSQEHEFYIASTIDDKGNPIWQKSTLVKIIYASYAAMRFSRHIHTDYNRYHVGQRCEFKAYAIDANDNLCKPSSIKKDFHEYQWIFYPTTFKAHDITSDSIEHLIAKTPPPKLVADKIILNHIQEFQHSKTNGLNIDGLVAETPISKEMTKEMVLYHQLEDKAKEKKEKDDKQQNRKEKRGARFGKINDHIKKYEAIYRYIVFGGGGIGLIISIIQLIIQLID